MEKQKIVITNISGGKYKSISKICIEQLKEAFNYKYANDLDSCFEILNNLHLYLIEQDLNRKIKK